MKYDAVCVCVYEKVWAVCVYGERGTEMQTKVVQHNYCEEVRLKRESEENEAFCKKRPWLSL